MSARVQAARSVSREERIGDARKSLATSDLYLDSSLAIRYDRFSGETRLMPGDVPSNCFMVKQRNYLIFRFRFPEEDSTKNVIKYFDIGRRGKEKKGK